MELQIASISNAKNLLNWKKYNLADHLHAKKKKEKKDAWFGFHPGRHLFALN